MHRMSERVDPPANAPAAAQPATLRTVGIIGGTGALGVGLATRLASAGHTVLIGSRDVTRAERCAQRLGSGVRGVTNQQACSADLVIITVPWAAHDTTLVELAPHLAGRLVIDAVNPLAFDENGPHAVPVAAGSAAQQAQQLLSASIVVGAFHHVPAALLEAMEPLDADVLVVGEDRDATARVVALIDTMDGLRGVYAGRLRNAGQVEALTANLIAINRRYKTQASLRITGLN